MELPETYSEKFQPAAVQKNQPRNEREELLDRFLAKLNPDRLKKGMEEISHSRLAGMLEGRSSSDIYGLYQSCDRARSFGGLFWHLMKPKV